MMTISGDGIGATRGRALTAASAGLLVCLTASTAAAQTATPRTVQDILRFLVTNQGVQTSDFEKDQEAAEATRDTLTRTLLSSVATLPVATSASGFSYRLNPTLGTVERTSQTFGPFFLERALTAGGGRASLGFTLHYSSFEMLDGNDLRDGSFVTIANQFPDEPEAFDVETLTLNIRTRTATFFGNVGVSDRVDVGIAVPLVRLDIDGSRQNDYRGRNLLQARAQASTTGLADIAIRTKVRLTGDGPAAAAAGIEARLPTGREEDLLGAGELALRFLGLGSYEAGAASIYGNLAIGTGGLGRELSYGGALAVAATPRFTIVGELLTRRIAGIRRIGEVTAPHPRFRDVLTTRLMPMGDDQMSTVAIGGFKWNVGTTWLLHANVLMPLTDAGLTATFTPTIALDYSFAR